jgi:hypothetical protein
LDEEREGASAQGLLSAAAAVAAGVEEPLPSEPVVGEAASRRVVSVGGEEGWEAAEDDGEDVRWEIRE